MKDPKGEKLFLSTVLESTSSDKPYKSIDATASKPIRKLSIDASACKPAIKKLSIDHATASNPTKKLSIDVTANEKLSIDATASNPTEKLSIDGTASNPNEKLSIDATVNTSSSQKDEIAELTKKIIELQNELLRYEVCTYIHNYIKLIPRNRLFCGENR